MDEEESGNFKEELFGQFSFTPKVVIPIYRNFGMNLH